jgi:hypothetical protein
MEAKVSLTGSVQPQNKKKISMIPKFSTQTQELKFIPYLKKEIPLPWVHPSGG